MAKDVKCVSERPVSLKLCNCAVIISHSYLCSGKARPYSSVAVGLASQVITKEM